MRYAPCDRPPLWEEGIREDVWEAWGSQAGPPPEGRISGDCSFDRRDMAEVNLRPVPELPKDDLQARLAALPGHYRPVESERFPDDWDARSASWKGRDYPVGMAVTRGVFQALGVGDWRTLEPALYAMADRAPEVDTAMAAASDLSCWAVERVTSVVDLDFAVLSEPVASFHAPVISPEYYRRYGIEYYRPIVERLRASGVDVIIAQAFGSVTELLPLWLELGVNAFWCSHTVPAGMDYLAIRQRYGKELRLIGGIDAQSLVSGKEAIDRVLEETVPALMAAGGYLPLLDDRVRPEVPYASYMHYREKLEEIVSRCSQG